MRRHRGAHGMQSALNPHAAHSSAAPVPEALDDRKRQE